MFIFEDRKYGILGTYIVVWLINERLEIKSYSRNTEKNKLGE